MRITSRPNIRVDQPLVKTGNKLNLGTLNTFSSTAYSFLASNGITDDIIYQRIVGTTNQIILNNVAGTTTLSLPQSIATSSSVQFGQLGLGTAVGGANELTIANNGILGVAGNFNIDLVSGIDTNLTIKNTGAGVANILVDGVINAQGGISVDTGNAAFIASGAPSAGIFFTATDTASMEVRSTTGAVTLYVGAANAGTAERNLGLNGRSYGGGEYVFFMANAKTMPSSNPAGGGVLYASGGALVWRGSTGTVTDIANA